MRKLIILTLAVVLFAASGVYATLTRTLTMGDANMVVRDDNNIWMFPSTLYYYPDIAIGEFGYGGYDYPDLRKPTGTNDDGYNFTDFGIHYKFNETNPFVLALYFTTNQPFYVPYYPFGWDMSVQSNRRIDLFYARMLGGNKFGFHFNYVSGSSKYETDTVTGYINNPNYEEESIRNYGFDFGLTMMEGNLDLAAGVDLMSWTDKEYNGHDETEPDGNFFFNAVGRYFYEASQKVTLIPYAGFDYSKVGVKYLAYDSISFANIDSLLRTDEYKDFIIGAGLGMNYRPMEGVLAIGDFGIMLDKYTYTYKPNDTTNWEREYKSDYFTLPYFRIGLDAVVFKWLDLRAGAVSYWNKYKSDDKYVDYVANANDVAYTYKYRSSYVSNETFLGAGFHWNNLYLDAFINPQIVTNGFNFISGMQQPLAWQVSLKYLMK